MGRLSFSYEITNKLGETGSLFPNYSDKLTKKINEPNECVLNFDSMSKVRRGLISNGSILNCYNEDKDLVYKGIVTNHSILDGGGISISTTGLIEFTLLRQNGVYTNSPYSNVASATILNDIITESGFNVGTIANGVNLSIRINKTETFFSAISRVISKNRSGNRNKLLN